MARFAVLSVWSLVALTTSGCHTASVARSPAAEALAEPLEGSELDPTADGWVRLALDLEAQNKRDLRRLGCVLPSEKTFELWAERHELRKHCAELLDLGRATTLVGRAVDASGEPLRRAEIAPECESAEHTFGSVSCVHVAWPLLETVRTDAEGRFRLDFERLSTRQLASVQLVANRLGKLPQRGPASVDLSGVVGSVGGLVIDLGDVQLAAPAVAYFGRVQHAAGEPVAGARVALSRIDADGVRSEVAHNWTDESGRTEFAAPTLPGEFCMTAHRSAIANTRVIFVLSDYGPPMSAPVPVAPDGAETVVILER